MDRRGRDLGGVVFGLIVLGVGAYFLLRNTLRIALPDLDWEMIWPILVVGLGVVVLYRAWFDRGHPTPPDAR